MLPLCYAVPHGLNPLFLKLHLGSQIIGFFTPMISDPRKLRAASGSLRQPRAALGSFGQLRAASGSLRQQWQQGTRCSASTIKNFSPASKEFFVKVKLNGRKLFRTFFWKILKKVDDRRFIQMIRRLNPAKIF